MWGRDGRPMKSSNLRTNRLIFQVNRVVSAIEARFGLSELDFRSRAILTAIAEADSERRVMRPSDILKLSHLGTPPTIYRLMTKLEDAGFICYREDKDDLRSKFILLTPVSRRAFNTMSQHIRLQVEVHLTLERAS